MDRLQRIQVQAVVGFSTLFVALSQLVVLLPSFSNLGTGIRVSLAAVLAVFGTTSAKWAGDAAFLRSRRLRRFLLGQEDIEGVWMEVTRDEEGQPRNFGYAELTPISSGLRIEWIYRGEDFSIERGVSQDLRLSAEPFSSFRSVVLTIDWPELVYVYEGIHENSNVIGAKGFGHAWFEGEPPHVLRGFYYTPDDGSEEVLARLPFYSERLDERTYTSIRDNMRSSSAASRRQALEALWEISRRSSEHSI